jgi:hypothetical protein
MAVLAVLLGRSQLTTAWWDPCCLDRAGLGCPRRVLLGPRQPAGLHNGGPLCYGHGLHADISQQPSGKTHVCRGLCAPGICTPPCDAYSCHHSSMLGQTRLQRGAKLVAGRRRRWRPLHLLPKRHVSSSCNTSAMQPAAVGL